MPKKIYDIIPPKVANKVPETIQEIEKSSRKKTRIKSQAVKTTRQKDKSNIPPSNIDMVLPLTRPRRFPWLAVFLFIFLIILISGIYGYFKLPKAEIIIFPKIDVLSLSEVITLDKNVSNSDIKNSILPAILVEDEIEDSEEFLATGLASNEGKAKGIIRIYNKLNSPFTLIKGTHFLSDSGKYFLTLSRVTIPAATKNNPGFSDAEVEAKEAGFSHNIGPSNFSVPKLSGTVYYHSIYGQSFDDMSGGYKGDVKRITNDDIIEAKDKLTDKLIEQAKLNLKSKLTNQDLLLEETIISTVIDMKTDAKPDSIADKFIQTGKVKVSALIFKKKDIKEFLKNRISSNLKNNYNFLENSLSISYIPQTIDIRNGKLVVNLESSVKTHYKINPLNVIDELISKNEAQITDILNQKYAGQIADLKVDFWPFWVTKTSKNKNRIKIEIKAE